MEAFNQDAPPHQAALKPLGSLAQSARGTELRQARSTMLWIGLLWTAINGWQLSQVPATIRELIQIHQVPPEQVEPVTRLLAGQLYPQFGGMVAAGLVLTFLGLFVNRYPVPMTVLGLLLYVGVNVVFFYLNPEMLAQGAIFKIIIVVGLVRSIRAALAYQAETRAMQEQEMGFR